MPSAISVLAISVDLNLKILPNIILVEVLAVSF